MGIYYQDDEVEIRIYSNEEHLEQQNQYKQELKNKQKEAYLKDTDRRRIRKRTYISNQLKTNPLFKLRHNLRNLIRKSLKGNGFSKNTKTYEILGCSFEDFKTHIEHRFHQGMSWENYGEWQYDHITPISWATNEDEIIALNHYTNFQPLWREENQKKSNKYSK